MIRDTIYIIDTIYVQQKLDSISQLDMGQHINTIHNTYDSNMTTILWFIGIAFGVIGILVPILIEKFNRKQLRKELKEELLEEFNEKIGANIKKINENNKLNFKNFENHQNSKRLLTEGILFESVGQHKDSINIYLRAVLTAVKSKQSDIIESITNNIKSRYSSYNKVQISEINPEKNFTLDVYLKMIEEELGDDKSLIDAYYKFNKTLLEILNTKTPPLGSDTTTSLSDSTN